MEWSALSDELRRMPFVRLILPFTAGIILALSGLKLPPFLGWLLPLLTFVFLFIAFLLVSRKVSSAYGLVLAIFLCFSGWGYAGFRLTTLENSIPEIRNGWFAGVVKEADEAKNGLYRILIGIERSFSDSVWLNRKITVLASVPDKSLPRPPESGDWILFYGKLLPQELPQNPLEFNYRNYLFRNGIAGRAQVDRSLATYPELKPVKNLKVWMEFLRKHLITQFKRGGLQDDELAVASALVLGDRTDISGELLQSYSASGATHILSVSGLHVGVIYLLISFLLGFLKRLKGYRVIRLLAGLVLLWSYALLTGGSPSVLRASVMFSFVIIGESLKRSASIYNSIAGSMFCLLLVNPMLIEDVGFQLSYLAVLSIITFYKYMNAILSMPNRFAASGWSLVSLSVTAQAGTFPLALLYFHQFPNWFLLTNLMVVPLSSFILYISVIFLSVSWIAPLARFSGWLLDFLLHLLNGSVSWVNSLPFSVSTGIPMDTAGTVLLYFLVISAGFLLILRNYRMFLFTISCLAVFLGYRLYECWSVVRQKELVVYSLYRESMVDITHGKEVVTFVSSGIFRNPRQQKTKAFPYRISRRLNLASSVCLDSLPADSLRVKGITIHQISAGNFLLSSDNRQIAVLGSGWGLKKLKVGAPLKVDCIILRKQAGDNLKLIDSLFHSPIIVSDRSLPVSMDEHLLKMAQQIGVIYYSVREQGAFRFPL